jgi:cell division protein ZapA
MERANVKIYGQDYTISGDKEHEYIERVAAYVDDKMKQVSSVLPSGSVSELAALAAVNITDELFSKESLVEEVKIRNEQLENDARHYIQLWEEAKKSFLQYKDEAQRAWDEKAELQGRFDTLQGEADELRGRAYDLENRLRSLEQEREGLLSSIDAHEEARGGLLGQIGGLEGRNRELENKSRELESGFFDIQMENTRLKSELDRYKRDSAPYE